VSEEIEFPGGVEAGVEEFLVAALGAQPDATDGAEQAHGHHEDNGQGQRPAFILRGQGEKDEEHAEREDEDGGVAGQNLLQRQLGPLEAHGARKVLARQLFHQGDGLARANSARWRLIEPRARSSSGRCVKHTESRETGNGARGRATRKRAGGAAAARESPAERSAG